MARVKGGVIFKYPNSSLDFGGGGGGGGGGVVGGGDGVSVRVQDKLVITLPASRADLPSFSSLWASVAARVQPLTLASTMESGMA